MLLSRINPTRGNARDYATRSGRLLSTVAAGICIDDLALATSLSCSLKELSGASVLLATRDQLAAALALIELDGVADRIIICPPDVSPEQLYPLITDATVNTIVSDWRLPERSISGGLLRVNCGPVLVPAPQRPKGDIITEWVLLSSGTSTGAPKMVVHSLASLVAPIDAGPETQADAVWGTFYDIRRYGGLQIFLRAVLGRTSFVLSSAGESVTDHLARLGRHGVTHLSGTPSHWRRVLMSPASRAISPKYIRLSGEIADQAILSALHATYPCGIIGHAFASTEAGVAFEVNDGLAGFPSSVVGRNGQVEVKIVDDTLRICSDRIALRYMDKKDGMLVDQEGFVDTGDIVELREDRYHFIGRRNCVINVAGLKVYPEEVEAVINGHPAVQMSVVRSRKNPITGSLVSADVVLKDMASTDAAERIRFKDEILEICRQNLPLHKVPGTIRCVPALGIAAAGKLLRKHA